MAAFIGDDELGIQYRIVGQRSDGLNHFRERAGEQSASALDQLCLIAGLRASARKPSNLFSNTQPAAVNGAGYSVGCMRLSAPMTAATSTPAREGDDVLRKTGRVSAFAGHFFDMSVTFHRRVEGGIEHRNAHLLCRKNEHLWGSV